jgi:hypothetical protein
MQPAALKKRKKLGRKCQRLRVVELSPMQAAFSKKIKTHFHV